jgi:restriction system protein
MKFKMSEKSLFAVLLRSPWWVSIGVFAVFGLAARALLPADFAWAGLFGGLPFLVIGVMAARRQWLAPSTARVAQQLERVSTMGWSEFAQALTSAYTRQGYVVSTFGDKGADLQLVKSGQTTLLSCKRWKAATLGQQSLQELVAARQQQDATHAACISLGQVSDAARSYAKTHSVHLIEPGELAALMLT